MSCIKDSLLDTNYKCLNVRNPNKVTVVGAGAVGMACVFSILTQGVSSEVVILDLNKDLVNGEVMDLQHGSPFLNNVHISGGSDFSLSNGSRLCIVTAGLRQREGESRLSLVQRNADIMKSIIPELMKYSPDTIILMVSNPVDILTYVAWKISGLPKHRVIGSGTNLDSARFRMLLSEKLNISPTSCHGYIIGEHGDSSIPLWSTVNVAGVRLREVKPELATTNDDEHFGEIHKDVVEAAYTIIKLKGYTSWAIGLSVSQLAQSIFSDTSNVHAVSVSVKGHHGVNDDLFMSLPVTLKGGGVGEIIKLRLNDEEREQFQKSAALLKQIVDGIKL